MHTPDRALPDQQQGQYPERAGAAAAAARALPPDLPTVRLAGHDVPVLSANTVVVGTGSAGFCAADRLWEQGQADVVVIADTVDAGTSRNAGSDKQTYYKVTLSGDDGDSVHEMARTLFAGGAMDGDNALVEAALSARAFLRLCDLGVPFPQNRFGEFIGYKTDHDPRRRATSVGPYTSRSMVERLAAKVARNGTRVVGGCRVVDLVLHEGRVAGVLVLRKDLPPGEGAPWLLVRCTNVVYATGGPAALYATRVFPHGQWGATGAALRAGAHGQNLTEWQFGLASLRPRWNVSGTYMQVVPRFVSTDQQGGDEREFLTEAFADPGRLMSAVFLKGYQWPFDVRKAADGSSLVDLLVHRETVMRGRRVFLDFTRNPVHEVFDPDLLAPEARDYLARADALDGTPVQRLRRMNEPAYQFYLQKNPCVDLETQWLEVDVCAQHNNGGLAVDAWWRSNVPGLYPVGEAAGAHGVYRPGGAALNSGQVGATRAAVHIAARRRDEPCGLDVFTAAAAPVVATAQHLLDGATARAAAGAADTTGELLHRVQGLMSRRAGLVRQGDQVAAALEEVRGLLARYPDEVVAQGGSRRSVDRVFLVRDVLTTARVYLAAMADYLAHGGRSRGSVLYTDPDGTLPRADGALPDDFRHSLDAGALDGQVQQVAYVAPGAPVPEGFGPEGAGDADPAGAVVVRWRARRPVPQDDDFFENVWREFRTHGNVC